MWCVCLCVFIWKISCMSAEVISLVRNRNLTCVLTGESTKFPIYIDPPIQVPGLYPDNAVLNHLEFRDWHSDYSRSYVLTVDKRWEQFPVKNDVSRKDISSLHPTIVSLCATQKRVRFKVTSLHEKQYKYIDHTLPASNITSGSCQWYHLSISSGKNYLKITSNDNFESRYPTIFDPKIIYILSVPVKSHWYKFLYSRKTSGKAERIPISFAEGLCLSLYVSVNEECFLDISIEQNNKTIQNQKLAGFTKINELKTWHKIEIRAESNGPAILSLFRGCNGDNKVGYWEISNIEFCNQNGTIYRAVLPQNSSTSYTCEVLNETNERAGDFCTQPGFLGQNCSTSCATVLGDLYPLCEEHKVCASNGNCKCASKSTCAEEQDEEKLFLSALAKDKTIFLQWRKPFYKEEPLSYIITSKCFVNFCSKYDTFEERTNNTNLTISNFEFFENCTILLTALNTLKKKIQEDKLDVIISKPVNFSAVAKKLMLEMYRCEHFNKTTTFQVALKCLSEWCWGDDYKTEMLLTVDNAVVNMTNRVEYQLKPFTLYEIIVAGNTSGDKLKENHLKWTTPPGDPHPIQELTVYSKTNNTFWVRWKPPYPPTGIISEYIITYKEEKSITTYKQSTTGHCELWDSYICDIIRNLEANTSYSIMVESKNQNVDKLGFPLTVTSVTHQEASQAPINLHLEVISKTELLLNWTHPDITNGPLTNFLVTLEAEKQTDEFNTTLAHIQKSYKFSILVRYPEQYRISVRGINQFKGAETSIDVTVLNPIIEISSFPIVEYCSNSCFLLLPKAITKYNISVRRPEEDQNKKLYVLSEAENNNNLRLELKYNNSDPFSIRNHSYEVYIIFNSTEYLLRYSADNNVPKLTLLTSVITGVCVLLGLVILLLVCQKLGYCSFCKSRPNQNSGGAEEMSLISATFSSNKNIKVENFSKYIEDIFNDDSYVRKQFKYLTEKQTNRLSLHLKHVIENTNEQNEPHEANRVVLPYMKGLDFEDYINANYIKGLNKPKAYIAAPGPKFPTVKDFWLMVWHEEVDTIVMATHFIEDQKRKCAEYWSPNVHSMYQCGLIEIELKIERVFDYYIERIFHLYYENNYSRLVQHFQLKWSPDDLTPLYADKVVPLVKRIHEISKFSQKPILFHCSQGINRTGTLILCDLALHMAETENTIDFCSLLDQMRLQRPNMVVTESQYILAHLVVFECLSKPEIISSKFLQTYKIEIPYIEQLCSFDNFIYKRWLTQQATRLNSKTTRAISDKENQNFFVMEQPNLDTVDKFWITVVDKKFKVFLFLNESGIFKQWPYIVKTASATITVTKLAELTHNNKCELTELFIKCNNRSNEIIYENRIFLYELLGWKNTKPVPDALQNVIYMIHSINKYIYVDDQSVLIACSDGVTATGLFITLSYMLKSWDDRKRILLREAVRSARRIDRRFVTKKDQLQFLFHFQYVWTKRKDH